MNIRPLLLTTLSAFALSAAFIPGSHAAEAKAEVGKPAPAFTLAGSDHKEHSLADAKGKVVVLEWTNPECPYVVKFYKSGEMQKLQKEITAKGVVWYRINSNAPGRQGSQTPDQLAAYEKANHVAATVSLADPESKVAHAYGARTTPHIFVINGEGTLVYAGGIDDKPTAKAEDIATAHNYLKAAVEETLAGKPVTTSTSKPYGCSVKYAGK